MKNKKLLLAVLPALLISMLAGCNKNSPSSEPGSSEEPKPIEIGDTVKEWKSKKDYEEAPLGVLARSTVEISDDFGNEDDECLKYETYYSNKTTYIGSDVLENPYFKEEDAKNGDIISLYVYVPNDSNVASLQLEVFPISMNNNKSIKSDKLTINDDNVEKWIRLMITFDTLETLGAIRLNYEVVSTSYTASFYVDDINITLGEETVKTDYEYKDESLYKTYEDYFKVGSCMSAQMLQNTTIRKIAKDNFNSLTAENEAKPERTIDQAASQKLAKLSEEEGGGEGAVAITIKPFEKIYDFCEANHIKVRHHTFVWFDQTPDWFFNKGYTANGAKVSKEIMLQRMENFIKNMLEAVNNRWPGLVYAIDVANEAINNHAIRSDNNNWYNVVGKDFVYYAFKYARAYAKEDQKLFYNDYSFDYDTQNCTYALNTLLKQAIAENLVDGIGIQGHTDSGQNMESFMTDAKMIYKKGLECQITELDITTNGTSTSEYKKQKDAYKNLITKVLKANQAEQTNITGIIVWGITDNASWKRNQYPLLFTESFGKKPAYYGFLEAIESVRPVEEEATEQQ